MQQLLFENIINITANCIKKGGKDFGNCRERCTQFIDSIHANNYQIIIIKTILCNSVQFCASASASAWRKLKTKLGALTLSN